MLGALEGIGNAMLIFLKIFMSKRYRNKFVYDFCLNEQLNIGFGAIFIRKWWRHRSLEHRNISRDKNTFWVPSAFTSWTIFGDSQNQVRQVSIRRSQDTKAYRNPLYGVSYRVLTWTLKLRDIEGPVKLTYRKQKYIVLDSLKIDPLRQTRQSHKRPKSSVTKK